MHWQDPAADGLDGEEEGRFVDQADIPTASAVHALAAAAWERVWWRELQILTVAYSGLLAPALGGDGGPHGQSRRR